MPIASAVVLTVAAALSFAAEHARSHAAALGAPHEDPAAAAPSPAVGSRALTGNDEDRPGADKQQP
jgi:hypothetical protein